MKENEYFIYGCKFGNAGRTYDFKSKESSIPVGTNVLVKCNDYISGGLKYTEVVIVTEGVLKKLSEKEIGFYKTILSSEGDD